MEEFAEVIVLGTRGPHVDHALGRVHEKLNEDGVLECTADVPHRPLRGNCCFHVGQNLLKACERKRNGTIESHGLDVMEFVINGCL